MLSSLSRSLVLCQTQRLSTEAVKALLCGGQTVLTSVAGGRRYYAAEAKPKKASPIASDGFNGRVSGTVMVCIDYCNYNDNSSNNDLNHNTML